MGPRLELHDVLKGITENVYFQPPSNISMQYPCIVYGRDRDRTTWAGNRRYLHLFRYEVTVIDRNPDSPLVQAVLDLPYCEFERRFSADNLNHDVFNLYF